MQRLLLTAAVAFTATGAAASAHHLDPRQQIVPEDQVRAQALLVRKSDLGRRWLASESRSVHTSCKGYDQSALTVTGEAGPRAWISSNRLEFVLALARVYGTLADADESWRRGTSRAGMRCSTRETVRVSRIPGTRVVSLSSIAFPKVAPRVAAFRMVVRYSSQSARLTTYVIAVQRSRAQVVLSASTFGSKSSIDLARLATVTAARLARAMRGA